MYRYLRGIFRYHIKFVGDSLCATHLRFPSRIAHTGQPQPHGARPQLAPLYNARGNISRGLQWHIADGRVESGIRRAVSLYIWPEFR